MIEDVLKINPTEPDVEFKNTLRNRLEVIVSKNKYKGSFVGMFTKIKYGLIFSLVAIGLFSLLFITSPKPEISAEKFDNELRELDALINELDTYYVDDVLDNLL